MREIKFRGCRIDNDEWVYGDLWQYEGKTWMVPVIDGEAQRFAVDPETVGQYTGLKDRNGKEIYEGDVLHFEDGVRLQYVKWSDWMAGFVSVIHESSGSTDIPSNCQVIGNIHEVAHLLEGEQA